MSKQDYRLRIKSKHSPRNTTYLVREGGKVFYQSGAEVPLALSNLVSERAAELRFSLQDAKNGASAAAAVRSTLAELWNESTVGAGRAPEVEVLP